MGNSTRRPRSTTGIALSTVEFTRTLYLADLTQAVFVPGAPGTWSAPSQFQDFPEFAGFSAGTSGIAIAQGPHLGIVAGEFGGSAFGVIQLPATSGVGIPAVVDWVSADVPSDPACGGSFSNGFDPHTVTAYVSPNSGQAIGLMANGIFGSAPTCLVVIDLQAVLTCTGFRSGHTCPTIPAGAIRFVALP